MPAFGARHTMWMSVWRLERVMGIHFAGAAAFKQVTNSTGRCQLPTKKPRGVFFVRDRRYTP